MMTITKKPWKVIIEMVTRQLWKEPGPFGDMCLLGISVTDEKTRQNKNILQYDYSVYISTDKL